MRVSNPYWILIATILLAACSSAKIESSSVIQIPNEAWWNQLPNSKQIKSADINTAQIEAPLEFQKNLAAVRGNMRVQSPIAFSIGFSNSKEINAFASKENDQNLVIFTNGFINQFGDDKDVLATVLGHELGHHQLGHTQPDYAKNRNTVINVASQTLGMISSYFIPFSGLVVGNAVKGAGLSYSRDDERDADLFGMSLALAAGYSPCGSYRFAMKMNELSQNPSLVFLSSHPGNDERIERAQQFSTTKRLGSCQ